MEKTGSRNPKFDQLELAVWLDLKGHAPQGRLQRNASSGRERKVVRAAPPALPMEPGLTGQGPGQKGSDSYNLANGRHYERSVHVDGFNV
jgi:hypothetical protein